MKGRDTEKRHSLAVFKRMLKQGRYSLAILILFTILVLLSRVAIEEIILNNVQRMGESLAQSYSTEEERNMIGYQLLLELGASYVSEDAVSYMDQDTLELYLKRYFQDAIHVMGEGVIDPYAVVNGEIVAANPWTGDSVYDVSETEWYRKALEADGKVIFTNAYTDVVSGKAVITAAVKGEGTNNVVAFDVFPENFRVEDNRQELPEGSSYFLCDSNGTLLYRESVVNGTEEEIRDYVKRLFDAIRSGDLDAADAYITDFVGEKRGIYYNEAENGWVSIITIPYTSILAEFGQLRFWTVGILTIFWVLGGIMTIRSYLLNRDMERTNETVRVLGNSYYAIYRVNYRHGTYDMIKGSDYIRAHLPLHGAYDELMATLGKVIHQNIYQDFKDAFSLEHLQELVQKRVRDFGGDFLRRFNGQYRWVNVRALFDESLSVGEVVLCFREVDEEKQAELRQMEFLENTLQTMKESEASKDRFFSNMSHDMRTPLNAILGLSQLAQDHVDDPVRTADYLDKINHSSHQLLELINDILELSKIKQGKLSFNESEFDLRRYIEDCCSSFQFQAERENKAFSISFRIQDQEVIGDPQRLGQVLNNLLSNAVKFTGAGGSVRVDVVQMEPGPHAKYQITVTDTGVGMSEKFLEKLFLPYERDTQFGAKNISGTGLGMPIAKSIVQHMGGRITVESTLGEGTTFTVTLPFQTPRGDAAPQKDTQQIQTEEYQLDGKLMLVAEDNELNMEITTEILRSQGAQVLQAWNGREALEVFEQSQPFGIDAILMDMQMPEMNGCEAAKAIRALDRADAQSVPIIAVTANAFAEDIAATAAAGMNAHVSKPIDFEVLKQTLRDLAGG